MENQIREQQIFKSIASEPTDKLIGLVLSRTNPAIDELYKRECSQTAHSPQAIFRMMYDRDVLPLTKVEVLEEIGPPKNVPAIQQADVAAATTGPIVAALTATLEKLSAQNEIMMALLADKVSASKGGK